LPQKDGRVLHVSSSASPDAPNNTSKNEILFASGALDFNRYEAEDALRKGSAMLRDPSMSNGAKVRLGAKDVGSLSFHVYLAKAGRYTLGVNYGDIGFAASPRLSANGNMVGGTSAPVVQDPATANLRSRDLGLRGRGERSMLSAAVELKAGENLIQINGGDYALDIDYLEITPQKP
jgi:hypothetical protein